MPIWTMYSYSIGNTKVRTIALVRKTFTFNLYGMHKHMYTFILYSYFLSGNKIVRMIQV